MRAAMGWSFTFALAGCVTTPTQPAQPPGEEPQTATRPGEEQPSEGGAVAPTAPRYGTVRRAARIQETTIVGAASEGTSTVGVVARMEVTARDGHVVVRYEPLEVRELDIRAMGPKSPAEPELVLGASSFAWAIDPLGEQDVQATSELPEYAEQQASAGRLARERGPYSGESQAVLLLERALRLPELPPEMPRQDMPLVYSEQVVWWRGRDQIPLLETHMWRLEPSTDGVQHWTFERTATGTAQLDGRGQTTVERMERGSLTLDADTTLPVAYDHHIEERVVDDDGTDTTTTDIVSTWQTE